MSADQPFAARIVRCPTCGGNALYAASNPARPFCSPRCKNNDFGAWASDAFALAARSKDDEAEPEA